MHFLLLAIPQPDRTGCVEAEQREPGVASKIALAFGADFVVYFLLLLSFFYNLFSARARGMGGEA